MNIEKELYPNAGKLFKGIDDYTATIVDNELDPIECTFNGDNTVEMKVEGYTYINLTRDNLQTLIEMIDHCQPLLHNE